MIALIEQEIRSFFHGNGNDFLTSEEITPWGVDVAKKHIEMHNNEPELIKPLWSHITTVLDKHKANAHIEDSTYVRTIAEFIHRQKKDENEEGNI